MAQIDLNVPIERLLFNAKLNQYNGNYLEGGKRSAEEGGEGENEDPEFRGGKGRIWGNGRGFGVEGSLLLNN